jgi:UDP-N-acetylglucosamine acyltransferase
MSEIVQHPTAIVSGKAKIGSGVKIGAYSIIQDDVEIGNDTEIRNNVTIANGARIGKDNVICTGVVIATEPQDLKFGGEITYAIVGDRNVIREYATVNRATKATGKTIVGSDCFLMAYTHVAHDCRVGNYIVMANVAHLGGHVMVEDYAIIGGIVKVHQFCRIGCHTMIGADVKLVKDVPPYTLVGNNPPKIDGINKIGLKRRGFTHDSITEIESFYIKLNHSGLNVSDGIAEFKKRANLTQEVLHCIEFIESSPRGILR